MSAPRRLAVWTRTCAYFAAANATEIASEAEIMKAKKPRPSSIAIRLVSSRISSSTWGRPHRFQTRAKRRSQKRSWRNVAVALKMVGVILSANAFHEKAGRSQENSGFIVSSWFFSLAKFSHRVFAVAMLPSALSSSESFRSVHVGRSQFSRCCYRFGDLWFHLRIERGPGD